jgi:macrolide-specific efflux system membrane fusion protein
MARYVLNALTHSLPCRPGCHWLVQLLGMFVVGHLVASSSRAADELVIDSALLRLTYQIDVPARAQGVLSSLKVVEGDAVRQGDALGQIDDAEAKLLQQRAAMELEVQKEKVENDVDIRTAKKAVAFHRAQRDRMERAAKDLPGSVSASQIEELRFNAIQAEFKVEEAEHAHQVDEKTMSLKNIELELGKHNVDIRKIAAPTNGVVVEVLRHPGEWVEPGEKVLRILRIDRLRAEGLIHASKVPPNLLGAPATVTLELPGKGEMSFSGKVVFVSPEIMAVNGMTRFWAEIDNSSGLLRPGLRPRMTVKTATVDESAAKKTSTRGASRSAADTDGTARSEKQ